MILDHNLVRFASEARAAAVWLGEHQTVENSTKLQADLREVLELRTDPAAGKTAVLEGNARTAYRGLWAMAILDAESAVKEAAEMLNDKKVERRFAAVKLLWESDFPEVPGLLAPLLEDSDLRIVSMVLDFLKWCDPATTESGLPKDLFERIERLLAKLPVEPKELTAPVPGWYCPPIRKSNAANLLVTFLDKRKPQRLIPHLSAMSEISRVWAVRELCRSRTITTQVRKTLVALTGELNQYVRREAIHHLKRCRLAEDEVQTLEGYWTRKTADFRRGVCELLLNRPDRNVLRSIDRLLSASDANQRAAGIELARRMVDAGRSVDEVRERVRTFKE